MKRWRWMWVVLWALLALAPGPASANYACPPQPDQSGGVLMPLAPTAVTLRSLTVTISVLGGSAQVTAEYDFYNPGGPVHVDVALPMDKAGAGLHDLVVTAAGSPIRSWNNREGASNAMIHGYALWKSWSQAFAGKRSTRIVVKYRQCIPRISPSPAPPYGELAYLLAPGAYWHGPIGRCSVTLVVDDPERALLAVPWALRYGHHHSLWHFNRWEPPQDLKVTILDEAFRTRWKAAMAADRTGKATTDDFIVLACAAYCQGDPLKAVPAVQRLQGSLTPAALLVRAEVLGRYARTSNQPVAGRLAACRQAYADTLAAVKAPEDTQVTGVYAWWLDPRIFTADFRNSVLAQQLADLAGLEQKLSAKERSQPAGTAAPQGR